LKFAATKVEIGTEHD